VVEAELERCQESIERCAAQLTSKTLRDLRKIGQPPPVMRTILEAMGILLGTPDPRGANARKLLIGNVPEKLRGIKIDEITLAQFRRVRKLLVQQDFDEENVRSSCAAALPLAMWCRCIGICLAKTKFYGWGGPEIQSLGAAMDEEIGRESSQPPALEEGGVQDEDEEDEASAQIDGDDLGSYEIGGLVVVPDLTRLSARDLRQVSDLTVTRVEVGSISFHGQTDCTALDLPRLVHLDIGEVLVYPEPGSKAPIGQGLNKCATVTMFQCWPPNGRGHLEDEKAQERYKFKIQQMTEEKRAKFIDYNCTSGVWKFQVDHF